jgi:transcriptional regulator with XRE-family HTH domain
MSNEPFQLAETLCHYVKRSGCTVSQLARLTDVPHPTLVNWLEGRVKKPRYWDALLRVAAVLNLNEEEATTLLQSAGHPSIEELLLSSNGEQDKSLLAPWSKLVIKRQQSPFQAIADLPYFVGREAHLRSVKETILNEHPAPIYSLQGMAGAGKTALAARIAYALRFHFSDGVLWTRVDHSDTMSILSAFAAAYDQDLSQYSDIASRSQVVRTLLAHKRALIVLDNVLHSEEIRPLIPPTGSCAVIVTTRRHDLALSRGTHRLIIEPFDKDKQESMLLFEQLLGEKQLQRDRPLLAEIADLVGHLPLAVAIVGGRLAYECDWSANQFLRRLRQGKKRLKELVYEDQSVALSFHLSYQTLTSEQRRFFAALSTLTSEDFSVEAATHVAQQPKERVFDALRRLYNLSLVQSGRRQRHYRLHPLLRDYAYAQLQFAQRSARIYRPNGV